MRLTLPRTETKVPEVQKRVDHGWEFFLSFSIQLAHLVRLEATLHAPLAPIEFSLSVHRRVLSMGMSRRSDPMVA